MEFDKQEVQQIDLTILLDDFLKGAKRLWGLAVLLIAVCAMGLTGWQYLSYSPSYAATASFTVKVANPLHASVSAYNTETAAQMAKTFPYIMTSGVLQERVMEHLDIPYMPSVSVTASSGSSILTITVRDSDPQRAYDVLEAVITYYPEIAEYVVGSTALVLLDESGVPTQPANAPNLTSSLKKGALLGVVVWLLIVVALAVLTRTVHNEDELTQTLNSPCLGLVPLVKVSRKADSPLILRTSRHANFFEAIQQLRLRLGKVMDEQGKKVLLVSSAIPGEGKTTVATNLAMSLANRGKKVLLIDCDLRNPSVTKALGISSSNSLIDFLKGTISVRDMLQPTHIKNLVIFPGGTGDKDNVKLLSQERMYQLVQVSRTLFDYVILDTPPCSLLADASEIAKLADCGILVVRQNFASKDQILDGAQRLGDSNLPIIGCVLNCVTRGFSSGYGYGYGYGTEKTK